MRTTVTLRSSRIVYFTVALGLMLSLGCGATGQLLAQFCAPAYNNECDSDDYIDNFTFHTLSNLATGCNAAVGSQPGPPYENYTLFPALGNTTTTVTKGQTYPLTVQSGSNWSQGFAVWIDYNNNNSFADPGENVYLSPTASTALLTTSVTIPATAATGQVRMRVRCAYGFGSNPLNAGSFCSVESFGETEDYIITIIPPSSKDIGLTSILVTPGGCFGPNQTVSVQLTNTGLDTLRFPTDRVRISGSVSGAVTATFGPDSVVTGLLAPGASLTKVISSNFNMSTVGTYDFSFSLTMPGDGASANNSNQRNVDVTAPIPFSYIQNFDAGTTLPPEIQTTQFIVSSTHGRNGTNGLSFNVWSFGTSSNAQWQLMKVGPVPANGLLNLDYRFTNWSGFGTANETPTSFAAGDSVNIFLSSNCGQSYQLIQSFNSTTHSPNSSWSTFSLNLAPYAGQQLILRVVGKVPNTSSTDFYADFDNLEFTFPQPDVQVTAIQPNGNQCNQGNKKPIILTIRNNGNVALSNIPLVVNVTGRPTINTLFPVSNFPAGAVSTFELNDSIDISINQLYTISAYTNLSGDVDQGNDTAFANITAGTIPPQPLGLNDSICPGNSATLNATGSGVITWYGSPTSIVTLATGTAFTTPVLTQTTTYYISTSSPTCGESPRTAVVAFVRPAASVVAPNDTTICVGTVLNLTAGNVNGTVDWSLSPTGNPPIFTGPSFQVQPSITTKYYVRASNSCGNSGVDSVLVTVNTTPAPAAPIVQAATTCPGQDVTLNATGTTAAVSWFNAPTGGTALVTGNSYTVVNPQQTDTLYAQAIDVCSSSARTPVVVTVTTPGSVVAPGNVSICVGEQIDLQPISSNGPLEWFEASSTGAPFATTNSVVVQPSISTTYYVRSTGPCGFSPFDSVRVNVVIPVLPSIQGDDSICAGDGFSLLASGASAYLWYNQAQGGSPIANTPLLILSSYSQTDTFYVESIEGNCTSARVAYVLFVDRELTDVTLTGADTTNEGNSVTYAIQNPDPTSTYTWTVTGGSPASAVGTSLTITWGNAGQGQIEIEERRPLGCTNTTTVPVEILSITSVKPHHHSATLSVYPNPANEQAYLSLTSPRPQTVNIRLMDATGRLVRTVYTGRDVQTLQLPIAVGDLADGLYLLEVRTDSGLQTARVLVRH